MSKSRIVLAASIASLFVVGSLAIADTTSVPTLQQCAAQLPKGKTYSFSIIGNIDTSGPQPHLSGKLLVSDQTIVDKSREGAAFAKCVAKLIR